MMFLVVARPNSQAPRTSLVLKSFAWTMKAKINTVFLQSFTCFLSLVIGRGWFVSERMMKHITLKEC